MESATFDLYRDIAERTDGDVYLGVVGPVRTGKSTFITRLMELLVMPKIPEGARKERIADELPQSGSGRTIMTTQPQFVPSEAVTVSLSDKRPCARPTGGQRGLHGARRTRFGGQNRQPHGAYAVV